MGMFESGVMAILSLGCWPSSTVRTLHYPPTCAHARKLYGTHNLKMCPSHVWCSLDPQKRQEHQFNTACAAVLRCQSVFYPVGCLFVPSCVLGEGPCSWQDDALKDPTFEYPEPENMLIHAAKGSLQMWWCWGSWDAVIVLDYWLGPV